MFDFLKKKFNFWLTQEIEICEKYNYDLKKYITPKTHPLHAKQIKLALFDGLCEDDIVKLSKMNYIDERQIIDEKIKMESNTCLEYFLDNFKPETNKCFGEYKVDDAIIGTILGDIVGSRYEFVEHDEIKELFHKNSFFTDDTVMTLATKSAIMDNSLEPDFEKWFKIYYKKYPRAGYGSAFSTWCISEDSKPYGSWANGSAMRISYVGAFYEKIEDVIEQAYRNACVTHNHIEGIKGAVVTAVCVWMAKNKYNKEEIRKYLFKHYGYTKEQSENRTRGEMDFNLYDIEKNNFKSNLVISCSFSVPYAIYCFLETNSLEECFYKVLEHFGDADTTCAIAGGIAGIYYGIDEKYIEIIKEKLTSDLFKSISGV